MSEYVTKTISVKLDISQERQDDVLETFRQFNQACRMVLEVAWQEERKNYNKQDLHHATYYPIRDATDLPANLVCSARNRVAETVKACVARWADGRKASKPTFYDFASVVYDKRTVTIKDRYCTLATVNGRVRADYVLGNYQKEHLDDPNYEMRSATLSYQDGMFFLNITIRKPVLYKSTGVVMGVDLGVNNIAVTSTGKFFDAGFYNWKRNGYFRTKRGLQDKGTRGARRVLKRLKRREKRFAEDHIHCVSKAIVQEALDHNVDTIVFEQLDHIRDRMQNGNNRTQRQMHTWAFRKLQTFVAYKAAEVGIRVDYQDARYTSQKCSRCGHTQRSNRNGAVFSCRECGYTVHADYNASKNIGLNYCTQKQKSSGVGLPCQLALKTGTLTPKGDFQSPIEAESTVKPSAKAEGG
jgi:IS605 OrfB family transposase